MSEAKVLVEEEKEGQKDQKWCGNMDGEVGGRGAEARSVSQWFCEGLATRDLDRIF